MELFDENEMERMLATIGEDETLFDKTKKMMWSMVRFKELQMAYGCAIKEVETKFDVLSAEFNLRYKRNPINKIHTRVKSTESIIRKLVDNGFEISPESIEENINDVAGIRIVCSYIDDVYVLADMLTSQDDITLIRKKDYIKNPKPNGYRSLHLIVKVPVFLSDGKKFMKVEVQIRTMAMDFWASLEHRLTYKQSIAGEAEIRKELKACAETIADTDKRMLAIRKHIDAQAEELSEEEILLERMRKLDAPIG